MNKYLADTKESITLDRYFIYLVFCSIYLKVFNTSRSVIVKKCSVQ